MRRKTYFIKTFGCQMNKSDSEKIAGWYEMKGWKPAKYIQEAEEVVINTCSVRQAAEDRVYGLVNNLAKIKSQISNLKNKTQNLKLLKPRIILTGCMMRYPIADLRKKLPQVDEFKKIGEFNSLNYWTGKIKPKRALTTHALVPIMEGCNHFCSYCVVPYARGKEISRPFKEIICEVEELVNRGCKEITLLGQNVNAYKPSFSKLLIALHKIPRLKKISFLTSNPWDLTDDIIEAMSLPKIDRYLHLPVQSGDDKILEKMSRPYTAEQYLRLVKKIRRRIPDIKIGADIIVGFPGETKKAFENTVNLCKKVGFVKAYIAKYSPRSGTAAYKLKDNVSHEEKKRRWRILEELINKPKKIND